MTPNKLETEADIVDSENLSTASSSSSSSSNYQNEDIRNNKRRQEMKRKVKKLRSIKLARLPTLKLTTQAAKVQSAHVSVLFRDGSTSMAMSDASSPNYMKTTTCSSAKKENFEKTARTLTMRSTLTPARSLTRLWSTKFRRTLTKKPSRGAEVKKKLKNSRSIKLASWSSIVLSGEADGSPNYFNTKTCSDQTSTQASPHNYETGLRSNVESRKSLSNPKPMLATCGDKPVRVITRTSSLRPVRTLTKMASLKTKRASIKKYPQIRDSGVHRTTCSSVLKGSKFPDPLELEAGVESAGISAIKVCPYSYCSLHGHHHSPSTPLKRFVSMRRRELKTQMGKRLESQSSWRPKSFSANRNKRTQTGNGDSTVAAKAQESKAISSIEKLARPKVDLNKEPTYGGDEPHNKSKSLTMKRFVESRAINMVSSALVSEQQQEQNLASAKKCEEFVQDHQFLTADSEPDFTSDMADKSHTKMQTQMRLWHLIYQNLVTGIAAENEARQSFDGMAKEEQGEEANTLAGINKSGSCQHFSGRDQSIGAEDYDGGSQKIQLYQCDTIKLVQEAFDRILSDIPDQSSDDPSIVSEIATDKDHTVVSHGEVGELSISNPFDSGKDSAVQDLEEMRLKSDEINDSEGKKAEPPAGNNSNQKTTGNWSNLKKIIILKRFVKELEKVRNFNPQKPRNIPVELEAEKIHLRHQTTEDRKNSEEWMLDYALQQVISTLAPAQKRKVALLVQAFEKVTPLPEIGAPPRSNIVAPSRETSVQKYPSSSGPKGEETIFGVTLYKTSCLEKMSPKGNRGQVDDFCMAEDSIPVSCPEFKETTLDCGCTQTAPSPSASETTATDSEEDAVVVKLEHGDNNAILNEDLQGFINHSLVEVAEAKLSDKPSLKPADVRTQKEFPINGEFLQGVPKVSSNSVSDVHDRYFLSNCPSLESNDQTDETSQQSEEPKSQISKPDGESVASKGVVSADYIPDPLEKSSEVTEGETQLENKLLKWFTPNEESETCRANDLAVKNQKRMRLWYLIYKHMVSGSAMLLERDGEEQGNDRKTENISAKNHDTNGQKIERHQIEAIKLVEEAIDEIPLQEIQDNSPNDESVTSVIIPDQEQLEKKPDEGGDLFISTSIDGVEESFREHNSWDVEGSTTLNPEPRNNSDNSRGQDKTTVQVGNHPKPSIQKSWSNLKKVILLKRFIKALEKVNFFNTQEPRLLPLDPENGVEKVHLRHQDMDDRKNSNEWMLDYALRQVVAKLTPDRKRKVELLVEAFETVLPTIGS